MAEQRRVARVTYAFLRRIKRARNRILIKNFRVIGISAGQNLGASISPSAMTYLNAGTREAMAAACVGFKKQASVDLLTPRA